LFAERQADRSLRTFQDSFLPAAAQQSLLSNAAISKFLAVCRVSKLGGHA